VTRDERFRPGDRIRKRSEYQALYESARRIPSKNFVLFVRKNDLGHPRLGITVSRRLGGAVQRNRAKRLLREIFRRRKGELQSVDIVVNGRASLPGAEYRALESELLGCLRSWLRPA